MRIRYYLSLSDNPLYDGRFSLTRKFQGYGQQTFIYDLISCLRTLGVEIDVLIQGADQSPLVNPLSRIAHVVEWADPQDDLCDPDALIFDVVTDEVVTSAPSGLPALTILHNAGARLSDTVLSRCQSVVCMTENAVFFQSQYLPPDKLILCHQGVDLERFVPVAMPPKQGSTLLYTRLERNRIEVVRAVSNTLLSKGRSVTILGDGDCFWDIVDEYSSRAVIVHYVPFLSMPRFLGDFELVVSSGRGAMEAMSCGKPTISACFWYGGPVLASRVPDLLQGNLTGAPPTKASKPISELANDIDVALSAPQNSWRETAEAYFDMRRFAKQLLYSIARPD